VNYTEQKNQDHELKLFVHH